MECYAAAYAKSDFSEITAKSRCYSMTCQWNCLNIDNRPSSYLMRVSTVSALIGHTGSKPDRDGNAVAAHSPTGQTRADELLRWRWNRRLDELERAGSETVRSHRKAMHACPPFGGEWVSRTGRPAGDAWACSRPRACPWCWARDVSAVAYTDLVTGARRAAGRPPVWAVATVRAEAFPDLDAGGAYAVLDLMLAGDAGLATGLGAVGTVQVGAVEPAAAGGFVVRAGVAALWPAATPDPGVLFGRPVVVAADVADERALARLLAPVVRFPRAVWYGDPARAAALLDARTAVRTVRKSGLCFVRKGAGEAAAAAD